MNRLGLIFILSVSVALAADAPAPSASPAATTTSVKPAAKASAGAKSSSSAAKPAALPAKALAKPPHGSAPAKGTFPNGPAAAQAASAPKGPVVPLPPRFKQVRDEMTEIYPDAEKMPVIWDDAHDPFRYGYSVDDDSPDAAAAGAAGADGVTASGKPAAKKPLDLDTASLMEAGLDMLGGKAPKKPSANGDETAPAKTFVPLTDAELLKRGVGKLRVGGVVTVRGIPRIMIDGVPRKIGDVIVVSVSGKQAKIQLTKLGDNTVEFVLQGTTGKSPSLEITF